MTPTCSQMPMVSIHSLAVGPSGAKRAATHSEAKP